MLDAWVDVASTRIGGLTPGFSQEYNWVASCTSGSAVRPIGIASMEAVPSHRIKTIIIYSCAWHLSLAKKTRRLLLLQLPLKRLQANEPSIRLSKKLGDGFNLFSPKIYWIPMAGSQSTGTIRIACCSWDLPLKTPMAHLIGECIGSSLVGS